jgi:hypothetical protein
VNFLSYFFQKVEYKKKDKTFSALNPETKEHVQFIDNGNTPKPMNSTSRFFLLHVATVSICCQLDSCDVLFVHVTVNCANAIDMKLVVRAAGFYPVRVWAIISCVILMIISLTEGKVLRMRDVLNASN